MSKLPHNATQRSHELRAIAQGIADSCPPELAEAIVVSGSVSRGVADALSDVEMFLYTPLLKPPQTVLEWMQSTGFRDSQFWFEPGAPVIDITGRYNDVIFELAVVEWEWLENDLKSALEVVDDSHFMMPRWALTHAVLLRNSIRYQNLQTKYSVYPEVLQCDVINFVLNRWKGRSNGQLIAAVPWKEAYRKAWFGLVKRQYMWVGETLQILFALNRQWSPEWKWLLPESERLSTKPERLVERINTIFTHPDPVQRVCEQIELTLDTLKLLSEEYDTEHLIEQLEAARIINLPE